MATVVPIRSFCFGTRQYRQDVTQVDSATDPAYAADASFFIAASGAKTANASFVHTSNGIDRFYRKLRTRVDVSDAAYIATPQLFT